MTTAGLIGFGLAGRYFHAPLLQAAGFEIRAVVSQQREAIAAALPRALVLERDIDLIARDDIDLIVIATPNELHATQARAALASSKHVVVDKPLCLHAQEADELIALARARRRVLTAFQNRRWDADFLTLQQLIASGRLGELNAFHARWDRFRPQVVERWREHGPGGGVLYDLGAHLIDQTLCLFGTPDWLQADVFTQRAGATAVDGFEILLAKGSARITLGVSTLAADGGPRYRVHGARGSYVKSGLDVQEPQLRSGMRPDEAAFGVEPQDQWGTFTDGASARREIVPSARGRWTEFYSQLRAAIEKGTAPPVAAEDAREVIRIVEAAMESSRTGQRVIFTSPAGRGRAERG
jgi:scyllo-inositol 2-dehydrogenase (NADP+)